MATIYTLYMKHIFHYNITAYAWNKISGPSANISNATAVQTQATGLVQGVYQFELKVTDAKRTFV